MALNVKSIQSIKTATSQVNSNLIKFDNCLNMWGGVSTKKTDVNTATKQEQEDKEGKAREQIELHKKVQNNLNFLKEKEQKNKRIQDDNDMSREQKKESSSKLLNRL